MEERIIRSKDLKSVVGISYWTALREESAGRFPKRRRLTHGCVGWLLSELEEWNKGRSQIAA